MTESIESERLHAAYQFFMLALCLIVLSMLVVETFVSLDGGTRQIFRITDTVICMAFIADFVRSLYVADRRIVYLVRWGWLDLLSSIPLMGALRWGRLARVARIIRVLRGVRATRFITGSILEHRAKSTFLVTILLALLFLIVGSVAVVRFEAGYDSGIRTGADALWWGFVTMTTVGYGDVFPVSPEGRVVAALLMIVGVGLFGTFTAFIASWFVSKPEADISERLSRIEIELARIRGALEKRGTS